MRRVLPDVRFFDLDASHPIFHSFFEIDDPTEYPNLYDQGKPIFRGIYENNDPAKRLLAIINFNTDISEFWEFSGTGLVPKGGWSRVEALPALRRGPVAAKGWRIQTSDPLGFFFGRRPASDSEIGRKPFGRLILNEPIVFFRTEDGAPVALEDRCAHRHLPLSMGKLVGDRLQCHYHGLQYDTAGRCVRIPGQDQIPPTAKGAYESWVRALMAGAEDTTQRRGA